MTKASVRLYGCCVEKSNAFDRSDQTSSDFEFSTIAERLLGNVKKLAEIVDRGNP